MANFTRNFVKGKMNKSVDERLIPDGEYIDAINVRMGSTEGSEIGVIENTKGNLHLTSLEYGGVSLSTNAKCIGAFEDGANETIYWFVHDNNFPVSTGAPTGKLDLIVSFDVQDAILKYHVVSVNDGSNKTTINFDPKYLITGVDKVNDLLFFTDNKNAPRFINVKDSFLTPNAAGVDFGGNSALLAERLLVIKRPPLYAPTINLLSIASAENNYLEDRYICFAYRYRYSDGEYSATSPFTDPAFIPSFFKFSVSSLLNEGMENVFNAVNVGYNTGGPLVKSIELLFKNAQDSTIRVIDKFNKADRGFADNSIQTYLFDNSNIFTILPDSEILRLYDNVPRFALGQTIMGNRLIYGNYIDGYNLQRDGRDTQIEYTVDLISTTNQGTTVVGVQESKTYTIATRSITQTNVNGIATFDFSTIADKLKANSVINISLIFEHNSFAGPNTPSVITPQQTIFIPFILPQDYANPYELVTSDAFVNAIGNSNPRNIKPVSVATTTSCLGITFTDDFNCTIPNNLQTSTGSVQKWGSAVSGADLVGLTAYNDNEPLLISMDPSGSLANILYLTIPYMRFVDDITQGNSTTDDVYEFYKISASSLNFLADSTSGSLHSNRGYEIGMVYMDDYGRSSTALVSPNNSLQVPCSASEDLNKIQVSIPVRQKGPEWSTHYKFVIKPDEENYDVIYSNVYYQTSDEANIFFLLEGENTQKVEKGDRLIVKRDSGGAREGCNHVTVLDKETFASDGIQTGSFAGTYMKINPSNINVEQDVNAFFPMNSQVVSDVKFVTPKVNHYLELRDQPNQDVDIPAGSIFQMNLLKCYVGRVGVQIGCNREDVLVTNIKIEATRDYTNLGVWLDSIDFQSYLDNNSTTESNKLKWKGISPNTGQDPESPLGIVTIHWFQGDNAGINSRLYFSGFPSCGTTKTKESHLRLEMSLRRREEVVIFETEPQDALPDVWFESADTYTIDANGFHQGSADAAGQNQTASLPAIVTTDFYNCFSFGNGAESYKIRDSIIGRTFNLGNRILTTSEKEYKEAYRYADLTYSGVYNDENNINKLNEFNLGLLNFKSLEQSFGPIQKLFGRETDILTLQEDKISYVLQGKQMITGATGGSALISVPEVLGKQVARIEDYGISNNPESFVQWGASKYFTDSKRGAVIHLKGMSAQNEQLAVISEQGMRGWFRDLFIDSFATQKLGGFDPYMNEYVLSSNNILKPIDEECIDCDTLIGNIIVNELNPYEFCVDVGALVGDLTISINVEEIETIPPNAPFNITYTYAGVTNIYDSTNPPTVGIDTIVINKNSVADQKINILVQNNGLDESFIRSITVGCPVADIITIVPISMTSNVNSGEYIHSEYSWTDGTFVSPLHSRLVEFKSDAVSNPIVSDYDSIVGPQGAGIIPADGATVSLVCNKINFDDFVFNKNINNFRYLRSNTVYDKDVDADMQALLAAATTATPIDDTFEPTKYSSSFAMPSTGSYLYLIWDYRLSTEDDLCFGSTLLNSCCGCL